MLDVARLLRNRPEIHGAIDVSDGLSTDLLRVCASAGVGCEVDASALRPSRALSRFCNDRRADLAEWMLVGGEDYALVLSVSWSKAGGLCAAVEKNTGVPAAVIGRFRSGAGYYRRDRDGKKHRLRATGWDHIGNNE